MERRKFLQIATGGAAAAVGGVVAVWPQAAAGPKLVRKVSTFCELCFWKCGVVATVEDGVVTKLDGHPSHPLSMGRLCPRGNGGTGLLYDPDRLKKPLIRTGKRGGEQFKEASWDEALGYIARKMERIKSEHGPEAMALFTHGHGGSFFGNMLKAYGSPNIAAPSYAQCRGPREVGFQLTFGSGIGSPENTDIANTRFLVLIGSHLGENMHNTQVQEFAECIRRGAKICVVDPRYSVAASKANWYLPIKPGTDIALLMSWVNVLLEEGLYNKEYVDRYGTGLAELRAATKENTPEWAAAITEIPAETIRTVVREMAAAKPAVLVHPGRHVTWYGDDAQRSRAIAILNGLLGSWGSKGGFYLPGGVDIPKYAVPPLPKPARAALDGAGTRYPLADETLASGLCDATLSGSPYPVKGWIVYGTNLVQSLPNPKHTLEAIDRLDLLVVVDVLPAEIAGYADVVLPEATYLERYDDLYAGTFRTPFVALRQPVVKPMYDSRPGWWIARELGLRLGLQQYYPWRDIEQYLDGRLTKMGSSLGQMQKAGVVVYPPEDGTLPADHKFDTPSGKVEFYSKTLAEMGVDAVPKHYAKPEAPEGHLRLLFGRSPLHTFGRTTNNRVMGYVVRENEVWVNNKTAAELGLKQNERVRLVNQDGVKSNAVRARVTNRIRPDCVYMVHGFGHTASKLRHTAGRGASDSELVTRVSVDPLMGGTGMFNNFVRLERGA
ncbi:MAG: molybdopterin-dependent oxidoreductase [Acidobacteria bacterium]|nr:molybdopterin-dependent oxidoreductase [Acidobacteriota bacterium]